MLQYTIQEIYTHQLLGKWQSRDYYLPMI